MERSIKDVEGAWSRFSEAVARPELSVADDPAEYGHRDH
jgi:hypothetical protein